MNTSKQRPILIAEGDSWFSHPGTGGILNRFIPGNYQEFQYEVHHKARPSDRLEDMVCEDWQRNQIIELLRLEAKKGRKPRAILLSAGGNDITKKLKKIVNPRDGDNGILNIGFVNAFIRGFLYDLFRELIEYLTVTCNDLFDEEVPILVHGYACAVPDGRGHKFKKKGWIHPVFKRRGHENLVENAAAVEDVMKVFNQMVSSLSSEYSHVRYVDLRPLVTSNPEEAYWVDWEDELHLTIVGLRKVAAELDTVISNLP